MRSVFVAICLTIALVAGGFSQVLANVAAETEAGAAAAHGGNATGDCCAREAKSSKSALSAGAGDTILTGTCAGVMLAGRCGHPRPASVTPPGGQPPASPFQPPERSF